MKRGDEIGRGACLEEDLEIAVDMNMMKDHEQPLSVFIYMDYREYLRDWYQGTKARYPSYSLRVFAKRAGFRSHNFLKMVMQGKRNLTEQSIRKFIKGLRLTPKEADYFATLVAYNQASDSEGRQLYYEHLLQAQELSHVKKLAQEQYDYYGSWHHTAVRELVSHPAFKEDPRWIAGRLSPPITPAQAQESLDLLQKLGMVERDRSGRLRQTDKLLTTGPEVHSQKVAQYHRLIMDLAKSAIERFPRNSRDISCLTLGISQKMLPILKRRIQLFREEVMRLISTDRETDTVIQFNLQFFPLTTLESQEVKRA